MACSRMQGVPRASPLKEEIGSPYNPHPLCDDSYLLSSLSSLTTKAIRASSAY
ncbi:unnamed protein product, partial [Ilex paraguariensis]